MKTFILTPFLILFLVGCQSEKKLKYNECMDSGVEELYGNKFVKDFCTCFADGLIREKSPFETANRCSKPIIEKMLEENKWFTT